MQTKLVFTRTVFIEGVKRKEMKIVSVNIPEVSSKDGWELFDTVDDVFTHREKEINDEQDEQQVEN